jgi:SsrA-binding protein
MATKKAKAADPTLARHRQAGHEYHILETHEAGIELHGTEVKALRAGRATLREGYIRVEKGEIWLYSVNIPPYEQGSHNNHDPTRRRRLLLHKREILHLEGFVQQQGLTMIPLRLYTSGNKIKLEFGVVRGKKLWDKREDIAARDAKREADRVQARAIRGS